MKTISVWKCKTGTTVRTHVSRLRRGTTSARVLLLMLACLGLSCGESPRRVLGASNASAAAPKCASLENVDQCPNLNLDPQRDYSHKTLEYPNFTGQDLRNANFEGATLIGAVFVRANLEGASFKGATFKGGDALNGTDFSFAKLNKSCFREVKFEDVTYFTYATTSCADFSETDIRTETKDNVITKAVLFGEDGLQGGYNACDCRTRFRGTKMKMSCEFLNNWPALDLENADVSACLSRLKGMNFGGYTPGVNLRGVNFSGGASCGSSQRTDLSGTRWQGVDLTGAIFTGAILDNASFAAAEGHPGAILTAASMNCISARSASFDNAKMGKSDRGAEGAKLDSASLTDTSFVGADLIGVSFSRATLTGTINLNSATLDGSNWEGSTSHSLDLSGVISALGANFDNAVLISANLKNTNLSPNVFKATGTDTIKPSSFKTAKLCGATLDATILTCADLTGALLTKKAGCETEAIISNPKTDGVPEKCSTACPDGSTGPCEREGQWTAPAPPPVNCPCQTPSQKCCSTQTPCPPRKRPGKPCKDDCDCYSYQCIDGKCKE